MKHVFAIVVLCLPGLLAAHEPCPINQTQRVGISRLLAGAPNLAWQNVVLFEQQIL